jgi:hypothetical protein
MPFFEACLRDIPSGVLVWPSRDRGWFYSDRSPRASVVLDVTRARQLTERNFNQPSLDGRASTPSHGHADRATVRWAVAVCLASVVAFSCGDGPARCSAACGAGRASNPNALCDIRDSLPCEGELCFKTCSYYERFVRATVAECTCEEFSQAFCDSPTCVPCDKSLLPPELRGLPGPTGVGLLCRPDQTPCCQGALPASGEGCRLECPCSDPGAICG